MPPDCPLKIDRNRKTFRRHPINTPVCIGSSLRTPSAHDCLQTVPFRRLFWNANLDQSVANLYQMLLVGRQE